MRLEKVSAAVRQPPSERSGVHVQLYLIYYGERRCRSMHIARSSRHTSPSRIQSAF